MMDTLIEQYQIKVVEAGCAPGSGRYGIQIELENDISAVFPYINAVIKDGFYDQANQVLIWREPGQAYALHPKEIRVARIEDSAQAGIMASRIIEKINQVWLNRNTISPCYIERKVPAVIDLFKILPRTNCKQCGYVTCLAYAESLRNGVAHLENCLPLTTPKYFENKLKLKAMLTSY